MNEQATLAARRRPAPQPPTVPSPAAANKPDAAADSVAAATPSVQPRGALDADAPAAVTVTAAEERSADTPAGADGPGRPRAGKSLGDEGSRVERPSTVRMRPRNAASGASRSGGQQQRERTKSFLEALAKPKSTRRDRRRKIKQSMRMLRPIGSKDDLLASPDVTKLVDCSADLVARMSVDSLGLTNPTDYSALASGESEAETEPPLPDPDEPTAAAAAPSPEPEQTADADAATDARGAADTREAAPLPPAPAPSPAPAPAPAAVEQPPCPPRSSKPAALMPSEAVSAAAEVAPSPETGRTPQSSKRSTSTTHTDATWLQQARADGVDLDETITVQTPPPSPTRRSEEGTPVREPLTRKRRVANNNVTKRSPRHSSPLPQPPSSPLEASTLDHLLPGKHVASQSGSTRASSSGGSPGTSEGHTERFSSVSSKQSGYSSRSRASRLHSQAGTAPRVEVRDQHVQTERRGTNWEPPLQVANWAVEVLSRQLPESNLEEIATPEEFQSEIETLQAAYKTLALDAELKTVEYKDKMLFHMENQQQVFDEMSNEIHRLQSDNAYLNRKLDCLQMEKISLLDVLPTEKAMMLRSLDSLVWNQYVEQLVVTRTHEPVTCPESEIVAGAVPEDLLAMANESIAEQAQVIIELQGLQRVAILREKDMRERVTNSDLQAAEERIAALTQSLEHNEHFYADLTRRYRSEVLALDRLLHIKTDQVTNLQSQMVTRRGQLESRRTFQGECAELIQHLQAPLRHVSGGFQNLNQKNAELKRQVVRLETELKQKDLTIDKLRASFVIHKSSSSKEKDKINLNTLGLDEPFEKVFLEVQQKLEAQGTRIAQLHKATNEKEIELQTNALEIRILKKRLERQKVAQLRPTETAEFSVRKLEALLARVETMYTRRAAVQEATANDWLIEAEGMITEDRQEKHLLSALTTSVSDLERELEFTKRHVRALEDMVSTAVTRPSFSRQATATSAGARRLSWTGQDAVEGDYPPDSPTPKGGKRRSRKSKRRAAKNRSASSPTPSPVPLTEEQRGKLRPQATFRRSNTDGPSRTASPVPKLKDIFKMGKAPADDEPTTQAVTPPPSSRSPLRRSTSANKEKAGAQSAFDKKYTTVPEEDGVPGSEGPDGMSRKVSDATTSRRLESASLADGSARRRKRASSDSTCGSEGRGISIFRSSSKGRGASPRPSDDRTSKASRKRSGRSKAAREADDAAGREEDDADEDDDRQSVTPNSLASHLVKRLKSLHRRQKRSAKRSNKYRQSPGRKARGKRALESDAQALQNMQSKQINELTDNEKLILARQLMPSQHFPEQLRKALLTADGSSVGDTASQADSITGRRPWAHRDSSNSGSYGNAGSSLSDALAALHRVKRMSLSSAATSAGPAAQLLKDPSLAAAVADATTAAAAGSPLSATDRATGGLGLGRAAKTQTVDSISTPPPTEPRTSLAVSTLRRSKDLSALAGGDAEFVARRTQIAHWVMASEQSAEVPADHKGLQTPRASPSSPSRLGQERRLYRRNSLGIFSDDDGDSGSQESVDLADLLGPARGGGRARAEGSPAPAVSPTRSARSRSRTNSRGSRPSSRPGSRQGTLGRLIDARSRSNRTLRRSREGTLHSSMTKLLRATPGLTDAELENDLIPIVIEAGTNISRGHWVNKTKRKREGSTKPKSPGLMIRTKSKKNLRLSRKKFPKGSPKGVRSPHRSDRHHPTKGRRRSSEGQLALRLDERLKAARLSQSSGTDWEQASPSQSPRHVDADGSGEAESGAPVHTDPESPAATPREQVLDEEEAAEEEEAGVDTEAQSGAEAQDAVIAAATSTVAPSVSESAPSAAAGEGAESEADGDGSPAKVPSVSSASRAKGARKWSRQLPQALQSRTSTAL